LIAFPEHSIQAVAAAAPASALAAAHVLDKFAMPRTPLLAPLLPLLLLLLLLVIAPAPAQAQGKHNPKDYTDCDACVAVGYGWSPTKQYCGGFTNTVCPEQGHRLTAPLELLAEAAAAALGLTETSRVKQARPIEQSIDIVQQQAGLLDAISRLLEPAIPAETFDFEERSQATCRCL